jgi:predicted dehydrogenase/nucleoside-diphosphate-sugar epimerase
VALTAARHQDALAPLGGAARLVRVAAQLSPVSPDFRWPRRSSGPTRRDENSSSSVKAGLVGAGYISEYHVAALRRIGVEIVGIHDVDQERARITAERFQLAVMPSIAALREAGADVIHVLTPPHTHAQVAIEALERGCHVLIEKPLAEDVGECERVRKVAEQKRLTACVNHSLLFDPQVRRALDAVRSGRLGKVVSVDILRGSAYPPFEGGRLPPQYRSAGYPFRDLGVHALYLFQALLGPIEDVEACWRSLGGDPNLIYDEWRAMVRCQRGLGQFQLSWNVKPMQSQIIIQGTKSVLRVDLFLMFQAERAATPLPKPAERIVNAITDSVQPLIDVPRSVWKFARKQVRPYQGLHDLIAEFYRALGAGEPVPVSLEDATSVVRWTEHVARAADAEHAQRLARVTATSTSVPYLVTGASGTLGGAVAQRLREQGKRVRVFVRRIPDEIPPNTEVAVGDLGDPEAVERAVRGAERVVHVGAAMKGGWTEHRCATVVGTGNVVDACLRNDVRKLVHVSSMSVIDWAGADEGASVTEETPFEPRPEERGPYTRAKLEAERVVRAAVADKGLPAVILRPGQIFGGNIPLLTGAVARRVGARWLVLGDGEIALPLVYLDDVVDAILSAADSPLRAGETIQLVDNESLTQNEVLSLVVGNGAKVVHLPRGLLFAGGRLSEPVLGALGRASPISRYRLQSALAKRRFDGAHAQPLLAWRPRVGIREGIRRQLAEGRIFPR